MKRFMVLIFGVITHVTSQYTCGCSPLPPSPCRPIPPCVRLPLPTYPAPCVCPRPPCARPAPIIEFCGNLPVLAPPVLQTPLISYETITPCGALPSCNCPALPSLPVPPQILPGFGTSLLGLPFGLRSPCLGGLADLSVASPLGLINPFLPASSPVSAIAPTVSSLYPPINPCNSGCKYLKKIPIPPPCL